MLKRPIGILAEIGLPTVNRSVLAIQRLRFRGGVDFGAGFFSTGAGSVHRRIES